MAYINMHCRTCEFHESELLLELICVNVFYSLGGTTVAVVFPRDSWWRPVHSGM